MAQLSNIVMNSKDAPALARWWAPLLGAEIGGTSGQFTFLVGASLNFLFQQVEDPTAGRSRIHFDFEPSPGITREQEVGRFVQAGASVLENHGDDSFRWTVLSDPDGNLFCVSDPH